MKRFFVLLFFVFVAKSGFSQDSPLKLVNFHKLPNGIVDLYALKQKAGRDCDFDNNKAALIRVKTQGFSEKEMLDFSVFAQSGVEIIYKQYVDGELWLYVSSNCMGTIIIKYKGEFEFRIPNKLDAKNVYELVLGIETATLVINTVPADADIYIDGKRVGKGYGSAAVSVGSEHHYKVTCDNYIPEEDAVRSERAEKIEKSIELKPNFGYITIKTDPAGAEVFVDDKKVGVTPYQVKRIQLGQHAVEVRKKGYVPVAEIVTIRYGDHNKVFENVKLEVDKSESVSQVQDPRLNAGVANDSGNFSRSVFTIGYNKKVYFSKGNLQYQASTGTWRFAENQLECLGEANKKISRTNDGWIDLFGWGTGNDPTKNSVKSEDYATFYDWGNNRISNGENRKWRSLTNDEWAYLLTQRSTNSGMRYAKARIDGVNGVILFPDDWNSSIYSIKNPDSNGAQYVSNVISRDDWNRKLEANGVVFLPAAGQRNGSYSYDLNQYGLYWTSTAYDATRAYIQDFFSGYFYIGNFHQRCTGKSVRLVYDVE